VAASGEDNVRIGFCLGCGSAAPEEDELLFAEMARTFEVLPVEAAG